MPFPSLVLLSFLSLTAFATLINRTIDDTSGDGVTGVKPRYNPTTPGVWTGPGCTSCRINPDQTKSFEGTWTAATYGFDQVPMWIDLEFTGVAIYIFFILANHVPGAETRTQCDFALDGQAVSSFDHQPTNSTDFEYNALAFSKANIPDGNPKLTILTAGNDHRVFVNFDYAIYTFNESSTTIAAITSSTPLGSVFTTAPVLTETIHTTPISAIVGGSIGGVAILAILVFVIYFLRRRRHEPGSGSLTDAAADKESIAFGHLPSTTINSSIIYPNSSTDEMSSIVSVAPYVNTHPPSSYHDSDHSGSGSANDIFNVPSERDSTAVATTAKVAPTCPINSPLSRWPFA